MKRGLLGTTVQTNSLVGRAVREFTMDPLVTHYLISQQADGRTEATLRWHRDSLRQFTVWRHASNVPDDPASWTVAILRQYIVFCQTRVSERTGRPLAGSAVNSLIRSLKAYCRWLYVEGLVDRELFLRVKVPKAPILVQPTIDREMIPVLLKSIWCQDRCARRDEALFLFMLDTGARASEVCGLDLSDLNWDYGLAKLYGKDRKERFVPFSSTTTRSLQRYLLRDRGREPGPFFQSLERRRLTRWGLNQIFGRISTRSGVHVAPHKLRHTFAIEYLRAGGSVFALQKLLGHTSLTVTLRYAQLVTDDLVVAHQQFSPATRLVSSQKRFPDL